MLRDADTTVRRIGQRVRTVPPAAQRALQQRRAVLDHMRPLARHVRRVVLRKLGLKSPARRALERQRWFRRGMRWRVGCEGRISVLKRRHDLQRCRYYGGDGMARGARSIGRSTAP